MTSARETHTILLFSSYFIERISNKVRIMWFRCFQLKCSRLNHCTHRHIITQSHTHTRIGWFFVIATLIQIFFHRLFFAYIRHTHSSFFRFLRVYQVFTRAKSLYNIKFNYVRFCNVQHLPFALLEMSSFFSFSIRRFCRISLSLAWKICGRRNTSAYSIHHFPFQFIALTIEKCLWMWIGFLNEGGHKITSNGTIVRWWWFLVFAYISNGILSVYICI